MENINVKFIHPTNNSDIDIEVPENMVLGDVFKQLIDENFLTSGQPYTGIPYPTGGHRDGIPLDYDKTIGDNGISNNDSIQIITAITVGQTYIERIEDYVDGFIRSIDISHPNYFLKEQFLEGLLDLSNYFKNMAVNLYKEKSLLQEPRISIYRINNNT
ncbi:MAG: hypothetical protein LBM93_02920 [Oscillospiraceae bacterium]|jgi:hypothetical protein|nr:hypothetical protein [Oscillospiraceae bacterium]